MRKLTFFLTILAACLVLFSLAFAYPALAQGGETLSVALRKDSGFSDFGTTRIQGTFSVSLQNPPANLTKVVYYIDGQVLGEATQSPYRLQFFTDRYPNGQHSLTAKGTTTDGSELPSNQITTTFVSSSEAGADTVKILVPILVVVAVFMLAGILGPVLMRRGKNLNLPAGSERKYGINGGTICPQCHRPFSINAFGMNLLVGKLSRCPFCGKWFVARRYPLDQLRAAEQAELEDAKISTEQIPEESEEEKLRKELDNSRYTGS